MHFLHYQEAWVRGLPGGNFLEGAANGLMVGLLNQLQHDVETAQQNKQHQKTLEKYNEYVKSLNDVASSAIDLANHFTKEEIAWLRQTGKIAWWIGVGSVSADLYLTIDAFRNNQPWGWYAYDTGIGAVSLMGPAAAATVTSVNSYVGAAKYINRMTNWINTTGKQRLSFKIMTGF